MLNREVMTEFQSKKAAYRRCKQGQATKEKFRNIAQIFKDGDRKT